MNIYDALDGIDNCVMFEQKQPMPKKQPIAYVIECDNIGPGSVGDKPKRLELWWAKDIERATYSPTLYRIIKTLVDID